jgi:putative cell wall-binding protein
MSGVSGLRYRHKQIFLNRRLKTLSIRTNRTTKRSFAAVIAAALVASVLALVASPAGATAAVTATTRKSGTDRYATAAAAADDASTTETNFVLASGESFADGLSASGLAGALVGTLLLTQGDTLNSTTLTKMSKMTKGNGANVVERVWVVGGTAAISTAVTDTLTAAGYTVVRVSGADRYATADAVAAQMKLQGTIGTLSGYKTCMLASGTSWADAAAASGFAYAKVTPIFLTAATLSAGTSAGMKAAGCQQVYVLGGTSAVSASAATDALAVSTVVVAPRLSGADRYATATAMATKFATVDTAFRDSAVLVSGTDFPDALAASQYASQTTSVILPVTSPMPAAITTWLGGKQAYMATIATVGGLSAVSAALVTSAKTSSTISKPTCVITAGDGVDTYLVTWTSSATMTAGTGSGGAAVLTSYVRTSTTAAVATAATAVYTYTAATSVNKTTGTWASANAPGDIIQVVSNSVAGPSSTTNTGCSMTVAAAVAAPTATIWAHAGVAATDTIYVDFSTTTNVATFADADITHSPADVSATAATIENCARIGATYTYLCDNGSQALAAGDTITIAALSVDAVTSAAVKPKIAVTTGIVVTDVTLPKPISATYAYSAVGGVQVSDLIIENHITGAGAAVGELRIAARALTAAAGKAGNLYSIQLLSIAAGAPSCTYTAATKLLVIGAHANDLVTAISAVCNTNAAVSALFIADAETAGAATGWAVDASQLMTGGLDLLTTTVTMSEEMELVAAAQFTISGITCTEAVKTVAATNNGTLTGVIAITCATTGTIVAGVNTVTVAASADTVDRAGNQVDQTGTNESVAMYAG